MSRVQATSGSDATTGGYGSVVKNFMYFKANAGYPSYWNYTTQKWKDDEVSPAGYKQRPYDICTNSHFDGFVAGYMDGHAKWVKLSQVWPSRTLTPAEAAITSPSFAFGFDPRQN
ncbi:hypothetical protein EON83_15340 [bacterium]|nr:MAG: hypothetical protein EON83_15340 [bacterium]